MLSANYEFSRRCGNWLVRAGFQNSRDGFNHVAEIYGPDGFHSAGKIHYINRTWEAYTFRSVAQLVVWRAMESEAAKAVDAWKVRHGKRRAAPGLRAEFFRQANAANGLKALYDSL